MKFLLLTFSSFALALTPDGLPNMADYFPKGIHQSLTSPYWSCLRDPQELSDRELSPCLVQMTECATSTSNLTVERRDHDKSQLYRDFAKTPAPANWDVHAAFLGVILNRLEEFDFSVYKGRVDSVKIKFELLSNGFLKSKLKFYGTNDLVLQRRLQQCFQRALPFPEFPSDYKKESQIFTVVISF